MSREEPIDSRSFAMEDLEVQEAHICARREHNELAPLRRDTRAARMMYENLK